MQLFKLIILISLVFSGFIIASEQKLIKNQTVQISLDLTEYSTEDHEVLQVGILGGRQPLTWDLEKVQKHLFDENVDNLWEIRITFPEGSYRDIPFKFVFKVNEHWQWENLPGYFNHVMLLSNTDPMPIIRMKYEAESGLIKSENDNGVLVDNYRQLLDITETRGAKEGYLYYEALENTINGNYNEAKEKFSQDSDHNHDPLYIDDFHWVMIREMQKNEDYSQALKVAGQMLKADLSDERRTFWLYISGEILLNEGKIEEAGRVFQNLVQDSLGTAEVRESSVLAYAMCLVNDADNAVQKEGLKWLEGRFEKFTDNGRKSIALRYLQNGYHEEEDYKKYTHYSKRLMNYGNEVQRERAHLQYLDGLMKTRDYETVISETSTQLDIRGDKRPKYEAGLKYFRAMAHVKNGKEKEGLDELMETGRDFEYTPYGKRSLEKSKKIEKESRTGKAVTDEI